MSASVALALEAHPFPVAAVGAMPQLMTH